MVTPRSQFEIRRQRHWALGTLVGLRRKGEGNANVDGVEISGLIARFEATDAVTSVPARAFIEVECGRADS